MKKILKRTVTLSLVTVLLTSSIICTTDVKAKAFSDVKEGSWYKQYVDEISNKGIIAGYPNGTFGPNNNLKVDELITMMVKANNIKTTHKSTDVYWGCQYIRAAIEQGWVKDGEFADYKVPINRGEIARIISRALPDGKTPIELNQYKNTIKDYNDIDPTLRNDILKIRAAGIISGYYDAKYDNDEYNTGSDDKYKGMVFGANKNATRAEASTMLVMYISPAKRNEPSVVVGDKAAYYNGFITGIEDVNSTLDQISGTPKQDNKDRQYDLVSFRVLMWKDYKYQPVIAENGYQEAKSILTQKIDAATVEQAIAYAKTKTDCDFKLETKFFVSADKNYEIMVSSLAHQQVYVDFSVYYHN